MGKEWAATSRDAKKFGREVELGRTYYTIETTSNPWGDEQVWRPWRFAKKGLLGSAMCGHMSAEAVVRNYGPVYDAQPTHIRAMFADDDPLEIQATPLELLDAKRALEKNRSGIR